MPRLPSVTEFNRLQSMVLADVDHGKACIVVCAGTACQASGSNDILRAAKKHILEKDLLDRVSLRITGCHGFCEMGPFVLTEPQKAFYAKVKAEDVSRIINAVLADEYVEELLYHDPVTGEVFHSSEEIPFFKHQQRSILKMNQEIDPIRVYNSRRLRGAGGFAVESRAGLGDRGSQEIGPPRSRWGGFSHRAEMGDARRPTGRPGQDPRLQRR